MAHSIEVTELTSFLLVGCIVEELERQQPGSKARIVDSAIAQIAPHALLRSEGNAVPILALLKDFAAACGSNTAAKDD